ADRAAHLRDAQNRVDDRGDRARRQSAVPARRRHAAAGRPRDRARRPVPRDDRRAGALTMARIRLGVDLSAVLDLLGGVLRWLGLPFLIPATVAAFAGEAVWPW